MTDLDDRSEAVTPRTFRQEKAMRNTGTCGVAALLVSSVLSGAPIGGAAACGFDSILGNSFSAMHPKSIGVALAIRNAVEAGALDRSATDPIAPGSAGYWRAVKHLNAFQRLLAAAPDHAEVRTAITVLLIDSGLWTRLTPKAGGFDMTVHVDSARPDDVVVVTNEAVLATVLERRLAPEAALGRGVLAIDGATDAASRVRQVIQSMPLNASARLPNPPVRFFGTARP
jgi:hypothetical protein